MKQEPWMSKEGHESGQRAEQLVKAQLAARSPVERFVIYVFQPLAWLVLIGGAVLGATFASDDVHRLAQAHLPDLGVPLNWMLDHVGGLIVGALAAFLCLDVPTYVAVAMLQRIRPDLFAPKAR